MADIFGTDIAQTTNQDWQVTATSDVATVSGLENLQQALERRWGTRMGALFYDPSYGNTVFDMLSKPVNQNWISQATVAARTCLMGDSRIADVQVTVTPNPATRSVLFAMLWTANDGTTGILQKEVNVGV
ncbi:25-like lysozyme [Desulfosporosinus acididurans]|uniref:25-like lysozyme n=1 Tax=Desulfosporosinus acididurans TaxID=476652 RepID=A0A0J1FSM7_9FIRM|nr:GPW/gp25 family protein [Desulfosporosinus acididurans]KLU66297.1 25-like lysozyme [Desulfosporosinus acididurans]